MDLLLCWVVFPAALIALWTGWGMIIALLSGRDLGALLPGAGLAALIAVGGFLTLGAATAKFTAPLAALLGAAGFALALARGRSARPPAALLVALTGVVAVHAMPIVLTGEATLAGYIKLDDTATWLAFTDQVMAAGRDLFGLPASTHEATLAVNVGAGYPVGAFVPLGVGSEILATDPAWLIQPYMAALALVLAAALWALAGPLVASAWTRALIAFVAAQPALLFGYYLWGGVKEVLAAALLATLAALAARALPAAPRRGTVPTAIVVAALLVALSGGGLVWAIPVVTWLAVVFVRSLGLRAAALRLAALLALVAAFALPIVLVGGLVPPTSAALTDGEAVGNLIEALDPLQVAGIWPATDFRVAPDVEPLTYALVGLAWGLAAAGAIGSVRERRPGMAVFFAAALMGAAALTLFGSPWVGGKALATAAPAVLATAMLGAAALCRLHRLLGAAALAALTAGVLWSNALAYQGASLAPHGQFAELEHLGSAIAGKGPALMTEYSPYGARHFLRAAAAESVSELRRRTIPRLNGEPVSKGMSADTDELDPAALAVYRTLVLRRSPVASRPPGAYRLRWRGRYYEAWQRASFEPPVSPSDGKRPVLRRNPSRGGAGGLAARLPLGDRLDPTARPRCADVRALARGASALVAARRPRPAIARFELPQGRGVRAVPLRVTQAGEYEIWLGGSVRGEVTALVDGETVGSARHELNNRGQYVSFDSVRLEPGVHRVELRFGGPDLHPGSGGLPMPSGPLVVSRGTARDARLVRVPAAAAERLCGARWDWIEARG